MLNCNTVFKENRIVGTAYSFRCAKESFPW